MDGIEFSHVFLMFDLKNGMRAFCLYLTAPPKIVLASSVIRALPGYKLSCPVTGSPPMYTALIRNSSVLVNTTNIAVTFIEEGNYTCVATNKYGSDVRDFSVILGGKRYFHTEYGVSLPFKIS